MRNLKKALVLLLSLAMMLSIMVMGAGAAFSDQDQIDPAHADAVNMCVALKIIEGNTDGTFNPKGNVTREQMAKMICVLDNGGKVPQGATGTTFSDVPVDRWSNPFIETCAARGIVVGVGDGKFNPAGDVTGTQAAKMLLVELGYNDVQQKYTGPSWATYVNIDASAKGYYDGLEDIDVNAPLSREHAAQMIWNALQANEVDYTYTLVTNPDGSISSMVTVGDKKDNVFGSKISLLKDKYGASEPVFLMTDIDYNSDMAEFTYSGLAVEDGAYDGRSDDYTTDADYSDLYGQVVKAVVNQDGDVYGIVPEDSAVITSAIWGDYDFSDGGKKVEINDVEYKADLDYMDEPDAFGDFQFLQFCTMLGGRNQLQGQESIEAPSFPDMIPNWFNTKAIDNNDNNKIDTVVVFPVVMGEVKFVNSSEVRVQLYNPLCGSAFSFDKKNPTALTIYEFDDEDVVMPTDLEKGDWVVVTPDFATKDGSTIVEKADVVSGSIGATKNSDGTYKVRIDGEWYIAAYYTEKLINDAARGNDVELVVYNGYYFNVDKQSADLDMAVITDTGSYNYKDKTIEMTLMFTDGSQETVPVDEFDGIKASVINSDLSAAAGTYYDTLVGTSVFYSVDKGTYTLRTLTSATTFEIIKDLDGNKTEYKGAVIAPVVYDKSDATVTIQGEDYDVNNSAMVVIDKRGDKIAEGLYESDGFTYMSGADFLTKNDQTFSDADSVVVLDDDGNIAALIVKTFKNMTSGDEVYALITNAYVERNDDNDDALYIDMITKDGKEERVETDGSTTGESFWQGKVISYTYDEDGILVMPKMTEVETTYAGSIKDASSTTKVAFHVIKNEAWSTNRISLADDPTIVTVGIDKDDFADTTYEGNALYEAASVFDDYYPDETYYLDNALYVKDSDGDIIAIFADANGDVEFTNYAYVPSLS